MDQMVNGNFETKTEEETAKDDFIAPTLKVDEEGFVESFAVDEQKEYVEFFKKYGFVVVRGVYEKSQMEDTVNEIWTDLEKSGAVKEKDVQSWDNMAIAKTGIFGDSVAHSKMMWENRQSPKLHRIYSNLIGTEDLLVSLDRVCVMRPTKGVPKYLGGEEKVDHPEWKTVDAWFHWDLNPWFWTGEGLTELEKQDYELELQTQKKTS